MIIAYLILYITFIAYLLIHLGFYYKVFRNRISFSEERVIFLYHYYSAILYSIIALVVCYAILPQNHYIVAFGLVSAHGIYSISFLELWSLAQGGFSIAILTALYPNVSLDKDQIIQVHADLGDKKRNNRIASLLHSKMLNEYRQLYRLTIKGKILARGLLLFNSLPNLKNSG